MRLLLLLVMLQSAFVTSLVTDGHRCGQRPVNAIAVITAGQTTRSGEFPWHAAIYLVERLRSSYICGGFLISDRITITAAHCVTNHNGFELSPSGLSVRLGMFELLTLSKTTQEHRVEKIHRHGNYSASSHRHDIAVLLLHTVAEFNEHVQPICLWNNKEHGEGEALVGAVAGWGLTENDTLASTLKATKIPMVSFLECLDSDRNLFSHVLFDGMFCAGLRNGTNVCNGDSGGAFAVLVNETWFARGVVSFTGLRENTASLCNPRSFAGFVSIPRYVEWIEKVTDLNRFIVEPTNPLEHIIPSSTETPAETFQSISEKKCAEHKNGFQDLSHFAYVARGAPFMRVIDCFAILISERFLISTADCRSRNILDKSSDRGNEQFVVVESEGQALPYEIKDFHQHPEFYRSTTDDNNLAIIELKQNVSIPSGQFVCLWSEEIFDWDKLLLYSATGSSKLTGEPEFKCFNQLLAPSIMIQSPANGMNYLVGLVVGSTCTKIRFIKIPKFIPWIETIVWK
ncbi:coagulation factor VII-like [Malaya genurostris]|uniref:coagulation factor VII-like n=1 Tax=Malaya genurostris TaxID=325434 RepID=UPI0026F3B875|nr:coagulation factor VII-like [Malaya genurostris]